MFRKRNSSNSITITTTTHHLRHQQQWNHTMNGKTYLVFSFGNFHSILNVFSLVSINTYGEWLDVLDIGVVVSLAYTLVLTPKNVQMYISRVPIWTVRNRTHTHSHAHHSPSQRRLTLSVVIIQIAKNTHRNCSHTNVVVNKKELEKCEIVSIRTNVMAQTQGCLKNLVAFVWRAINSDFMLVSSNLIDQMSQQHLRSNWEKNEKDHDSWAITALTLHWIGGKFLIHANWWANGDSSGFWGTIAARRRANRLIRSHREMTSTQRHACAHDLHHWVWEAEQQKH